MTDPLEEIVGACVKVVQATRSTLPQAIRQLRDLLTPSWRAQTPIRAGAELPRMGLAPDTIHVLWTKCPYTDGAWIRWGSYEDLGRAVQFAGESGLLEWRIDCYARLGPVAWRGKGQDSGQ